MQISKECKRFCKVSNLQSVCVYGGTGISEQIAELKRGTEIIVCTPGRMIDMLAANGGESHKVIVFVECVVMTFGLCGSLDALPQIYIMSGFMYCHSSSQMTLVYVKLGF